MRALPGFVSCAAFAAIFAGCTPRPPAVVARPAAPAAEKTPECPETIAPGRDALDPERFEGKPVARVCIVGSEAARKEAERVALLHAGETYSAARVRTDLEGLMKLGVLDDVSVYGLPAQQGTSVVVLYAVHQRPRIADIAFEGAKVLADTEMVKKLPLAKGTPYEPLRINAVAQNVREEYLARGYEGCRVVLVSEPAAGAPDQVSVRVKVDEGPQWHLSKLAFRGNKKVSEADLRKAAGLTVGQPYVKDEIERATLAVSGVLFDRGFIAMHLDPEQGPVDDKGNVALTFAIEEGDVHTIHAFHVTKLGAPLEQEILGKVMRTRPNQVFSRVALVDDVARVKEFFKKRGQVVEVDPITNVDPKKHTIDLTLEVRAP